MLFFGKNSNEDKLYENRKFQAVWHMTPYAIKKLKKALNFTFEKTIFSERDAASLFNLIYITMKRHHHFVVCFANLI